MQKDNSLSKKYDEHKGKEFLGTADSNEAEEWIRATERIFMIMRCTDEEKLLLAGFSMNGEAQIWWESTERLYKAAERVITWEDFKREMTTRYIPRVLQDRKAMKFT